MQLWVPDREGRDALGELPPEVTLGLIPPRGELPAGVLDAELLVPGAGDRRILERLAQLRRLRLIQTLSAGVDWLLPFAPAGVTICDAAGARDVAVAEWVLAAILASTKQLPELRDGQREHSWRWQRSAELAGASVLILGYGAIGAAVEARLEPFEVAVIRVARHARDGVHAVEELATLLALADVVVVLVPLTAATAGMLDASMLGRMRTGALLVNAARGSILDGDALLAELQSGRIRAVLDVVSPEPLPPGNPLWDAPGTLITPHLAGDTLAAERRAYALVGEQARRLLDGRALVNVVTDGY